MGIIGRGAKLQKGVFEFIGAYLFSGSAIPSCRAANSPHRGMSRDGRDPKGISSYMRPGICYCLRTGPDKTSPVAGAQSCFYLVYIHGRRPIGLRILQESA